METYCGCHCVPYVCACAWCTCSGIRVHLYSGEGLGLCMCWLSVVVVSPAVRIAALDVRFVNLKDRVPLQARTLAAMRVACNPNAVAPLATPGPVRTACRAAATRAECAAAAGALGLVEYGRNAPPIPQSMSLAEAAEAQAESPGEGPAAGGKMAVGEAAARAECARADTARCEWLQVAEEDEGVCVADAGASAAVQRQRQLDVEDAVCMADNGYIEGTQQLTGCQQGTCAACCACAVCWEPVRGRHVTNCLH